MDSPLGKISDFLEFLRFRICFFTAFLGMVGYLLFSPPSESLLYVYLASFFICMGVYSHNNITDTKEDEINRCRINPLSKSRASYFLVLLTSVLGLSFSLLLNTRSLFIALLFMALGLAYNSLKLKRFVLVKNLYTSMLISFIFVMGMPRFDAEAARYYAIVYLVFLVGSMISDMRDMKGDRISGFRTVPVVLGEEKAKSFVMSLMLVIFLLIMATPKFYVLLPFEFTVLLLLIKNKAMLAHNVGGFSILAMFLWLMA